MVFILKSVSRIFLIKLLHFEKCKIFYSGPNFLNLSFISLSWIHVSSNKKNGPDRFSRFDVYWQTNTKTDKPKYIERGFSSSPPIFYIFVSKDYNIWSFWFENLGKDFKDKLKYYCYSGLWSMLRILPNIPLSWNLISRAAKKVERKVRPGGILKSTWS